MSSIAFLAGQDFSINFLSGSGIGFYSSAGFAFSVPVGSYNGRTFITDSTGTSQGPEVDNCQFLNTSGVVFGNSGSGINLLQLPNYLATLNIQFTNSGPVRVQNAKLYISDRVSKNNDPSGVTVKVAEIIHPNTVQNLTGSGDPTWLTAHGSGVVVSLVDSPGVSGLSPNGPNTSATQHDWFVAISCSPTNVGSHEFMATMELEYL